MSAALPIALAAWLPGVALAAIPYVYRSSKLTQSYPDLINFAAGFLLRRGRFRLALHAQGQRLPLSRQ